MQRTDTAFFHDCIDRAIETLPSAMQAAASEVVVSVIDWPPEPVMRAFGLTDASDLTGLYEGIPMTEKSFADQPLGPDTIWLFRMPILAEWQARGDVDLETLVAHVFVHELAHHFGWSDADIARIDRWWE